jgi:hypothetical protein
MIELESQRFPRKTGAVTLRFSEDDIRHILLDLESKSKIHRPGTIEFKKKAGEWLERCEKERQTERGEYD